MPQKQTNTGQSNPSSSDLRKTMFQVEIFQLNGSIRKLDVPDECTVGSGERSEIRLNSWRVSKDHARLFKTPSGVLLEDMGAYLGVTVNGQRITAQFGPLADSDVIGIGPFTLRVFAPTPKGSVAAIIETTARHPAAPLIVDSNEARHVTTAPDSSLLDGKHRKAVSLITVAPTAANVPSQHRDLEFEWRKRLHTILLETMDLRRHDISGMSDAQLRSETSSLVRQIMLEQKNVIPPELDHELLSKQVLDEAIGLGPLEELLSDNSVTEIMVNQFDKIYIERSGRLERHPLTFTSERAVLGVIERIVAPLGRRIDESSPMVDARLKDGSRVNAIIGPLALRGAALTIRKFAKYKMTAQDLVRLGAMNEAMAEFLQVCVASRKNIVVSGGTGSGKTTLLNILSNFIPAGERIITVEDAAELQLHHEHLISLESRPANVEGKGAVTIRDLLKNTLRMRPDRIVIGECRAGEALDMLQAMNTGHDGSLTTLHANSPRDGLARLETMVLMAGMDLPLPAIRDQIVSAIDLVVQQTRFACGTRMVTSITEVTGMESGKFQMQEIFKFVNNGYRKELEGARAGKVDGYFTGCDMVPSFYEELRASGSEVRLDIFKPATVYRKGDDATNGHGDPAWNTGEFSANTTSTIHGRPHTKDAP